MTSPILQSMTIRAKKGEAQRYFREVVMPYEGDECLIWPFHRNAGGYGLLRSNGRTRDAHRVVCEAANGQPPTPSHEAAHSCGSGHLGCVTKRHLVWKTHKENEADKVAHGTVRRGEANTNAKLTVEAVRAIRALSGLQTKTATAAQFCVSIRTIGLVQAGERWGWVP